MSTLQSKTVNSRLSPPRQVFFAGDVTLESGRTLKGVEVAYDTWGRLNDAADNAIVVCHSLTGDSHVPTWWPGLIGSGAPIDTDRYFVVCANMLGSCYGTTGPSSTNPETGRPYRADFPVPTIRDGVRLHRRLMDRLGVRRVHAAIGGSLGGMQVLEWGFERVGAKERPELGELEQSEPEGDHRAPEGKQDDSFKSEPFVQHLIPVATSGRHSAWCIAWSESQRQAIYADPAWNGGNYSAAHEPRQGLGAARMMAMLSYRTQASFERRFGTNTATVQSYLHHQGKKLVDRFDANSYVRLSHSANTHDVGRGRGNYNAVLARLTQPTLVIGVDSDVLFPLREQEELARIMPNAELAIIKSEHGHDGFLLETPQLGALLRDWLRSFEQKIEETSCILT